MIWVCKKKQIVSVTPLACAARRRWVACNLPLGNASFHKHNFLHSAFLLEFPLGSLLIHYVGCPEVKELIQILIWQRIKHPNLSSSFTNPMPVVSLGLRLTTTCARQVRLRENTQAVPQFHVGIPISLIDGPMLILKTHLMTKSPCEYNVCNK